MNYNEELKQIFFSKIPQLKQYEIYIDLDKWALLPEKTKCYLYKITNLTNEKIYLETGKICPVYYWGYHLGELPHLTLKLPYYHSSKNKVFKRMYFNSLSNVKIEIWSMGNKEAMTLQEHFELKSVNNCFGVVILFLLFTKKKKQLLNKKVPPRDSAVFWAKQ